MYFTHIYMTIFAIYTTKKCPPYYTYTTKMHIFNLYFPLYSLNYYYHHYFVILIGISNRLKHHNRFILSYCPHPKNIMYQKAPNVLFKKMHTLQKVQNGLASCCFSYYVVLLKYHNINLVILLLSL